MAIFLTIQEIKRKNGGLYLVLWHAKPPAFIAMLNIKMSTLHDMTTIQIIGRTYRTEKDTNNS